MENYLIEGIQEFKNIQKESTYLILFHIDKQPPHLGVLDRGKYYSLRYDKLQMGLDFQTILKTVEAHKIQCLIFEIKVDSESEDAAVVFEKYDSIEQISCLHPIREFFFPEGFESIQLVFDLLDNLNWKRRVLNTYSLNLGANTKNYEMKRYSIQQVQEEIKRLNK